MLTFGGSISFYSQNSNLKRLFLLLVFIQLLTSRAYSQNSDSLQQVVMPVEVKKPWYKELSLRGYSQIRYNGLSTNDELECEQCDKSWGGAEELFVRRARIIFSGNVHDRVSVYIQQDLASSPASGVLNFVQIRDLYADIYLDKRKEFRIRPGISKIPYGFENLQSSQNRLPLDRNDALNSAVANERDLGAFFYYAPVKIRERLKFLQNGIYKGSGDYGMIGLGFYNGQTLNKPDQNDNFHTVARITYPHEFKNGQIVEAGVQAYTGKYVVTSRTPGVKGPKEFTDQRAAASLLVYPQPLGFQAEYNIGKGPQYVPATNSIETKDLSGGYVMTMCKLLVHKMYFFPFVRYQWYEGGKKHELDARSYKVNELELGLEWQPIRNLELVVMYVFSDRTFEDAINPDNTQAGSLLRTQLQFNY